MSVRNISFGHSDTPDDTCCDPVASDRFVSSYVISDITGAAAADILSEPCVQAVEQDQYVHLDYIREDLEVHGGWTHGGDGGGGGEGSALRDLMGGAGQHRNLAQVRQVASVCVCERCW